jgi:hypothetical protein
MIGLLNLCEVPYQFLRSKDPTVELKVWEAYVPPSLNRLHAR